MTISANRLVEMYGLVGNEKLEIAKLQADENRDRSNGFSPVEAHVALRRRADFKKAAEQSLSDASSL
jgi:hypothetical protein